MPQQSEASGAGGDLGTASARAEAGLIRPGHNQTNKKKNEGRGALSPSAAVPCLNGWKPAARRQLLAGKKPSAAIVHQLLLLLLQRPLAGGCSQGWEGGWWGGVSPDPLILTRTQPSALLVRGPRACARSLEERGARSPPSGGDQTKAGRDAQEFTHGRPESSSTDPAHEPAKATAGRPLATAARSEEANQP